VNKFRLIVAIVILAFISIPACSLVGNLKIYSHLNDILSAPTEFTTLGAAQPVHEYYFTGEILPSKTVVSDFVAAYDMGHRNSTIFYRDSTYISDSIVVRLSDNSIANMKVVDLNWRIIIEDEEFESTSELSKEKQSKESRDYYYGIKIGESIQFVGNISKINPATIENIRVVRPATDTGNLLWNYAASNKFLRMMTFVLFWFCLIPGILILVVLLG
jgi:hypothetical protein